MWNHLAHDSTVPGSARWALLRGATTVSGRKNTKHDADELHVWLSAQPTDRLVELIWDQAQGDDRFRDQLLMQAARQQVGGLNLAPFIAAIDRATAVSDFVDYAEAYSYSSGIRELLTNLEQLLRDGQAAAVIELAEHAHRSVEENLESVDDSDGYLGGCSTTSRNSTLLPAGRPGRTPRTLPTGCSRSKRARTTASPAQPRPTPESWARRAWPRTAGWPKRSGPRSPRSGQATHRAGRESVAPSPASWRPWRANPATWKPRWP